MKNYQSIGKIGKPKYPKPNKPVLNAIKFVEKYLEIFAQQDYFQKIRNENGLTQKLVLLLNSKSKFEEFFFHAEFMEDTTKGNSPRVDIAIILDESQKRIFAFEAKRLPAPANVREKEYVIGRYDVKNGNYKNSGGIERFKNETHGKKLNFSGMLSYVQEENFEHWYTKINSWIDELIVSKPETWNKKDKLTCMNTKSEKIAKYNSLHNRKKENSPAITLFHLWIKLRN